jgi:hypothetical protein
MNRHRRVNQRRLNQLQSLRPHDYHHDADKASWWVSLIIPSWDYYLAYFTTRGSMNHNNTNSNEEHQNDNDITVRNEIHRHQPNFTNATTNAATTTITTQQQEQQQKHQPFIATTSRAAVIQESSLDDLSHDVKKIQTCTIFLENAPICQAIPCMHKSYCVQCARKLCFGADHARITTTGNTGIQKHHGELKCNVCCQDVHAPFSEVSSTKRYDRTL